MNDLYITTYSPSYGDSYAPIYLPWFVFEETEHYAASYTTFTVNITPHPAGGSDKPVAQA